uniref:Sushi domain-containing protein n=1 Tax=Lepisosteus oculatus TaxID=7918 RepID=W5ML21_LEPOC
MCAIQSGQQSCTVTKMVSSHVVLFFLIWGCVDVLTKTSACSYIPNVANAYVSKEYVKDNYTNGDLLYFTCHSGYVSRGRISYKCEKQYWVVHRPGRCEPKQCGHPGDVLNGRFQLIHGADFVFGAEIQYICNEGYQMASQRDTKTCRADGWSQNTPHCEVVKCILEETTDDIIVKGVPENNEPIPYGSALLFECASPDTHLNGVVFIVFIIYTIYLLCLIVI